MTQTDHSFVIGIHLHKYRLAHGARGFGGNRPVTDAEKGNTVVTSQPVELNNVTQQHPVQQEYPVASA
jgi:hypothetical protein